VAKPKFSQKYFLNSAIGFAMHISQPGPTIDQNPHDQYYLTKSIVEVFRSFTEAPITTSSLTERPGSAEVKGKIIPSLQHHPQTFSQHPKPTEQIVRQNPKFHPRSLRLGP
jgi:hypothetical protein